MIHYETIYIASPDADERKLVEINDKISELIKKHKGKVDTWDDWGIRILGYKIGSHESGHYVRVEYQTETSAVREIERSLQLRDDVLKQLTIRIEKEK